jgi:DNA primase
MQPLRPGLICEVARAAGLVFQEKADKSPFKCPFHDDRHASAFLSASKNLFFCSVCTPEGGWSAKRFAEAVNVNWTPFARELDQREVISRPASKVQATEFNSDDAQATWSIALARARDDEHAQADLFAYDYLSRRGILESWELGSFGILAPRMTLHPSVSDWPGRGYWIVAPLYDASGVIANIQGRAVNEARPKTLFPEGSRATGTLFASQRGLEVLRGGTPDREVLFGEGLTDFLALSVASRIPVLSAPGTGMCASGIGAWARSRDVYLATDCDTAGGNALSATADAAYRNGAHRVRRIVWPGGAKDACEVVARSGVVGLAEFLNTVIAS